MAQEEIVDSSQRRSAEVAHTTEMQRVWLTGLCNRAISEAVRIRAAFFVNQMLSPPVV
jgi:hypothetical protein